MHLREIVRKPNSYKIIDAGSDIDRQKKIKQKLENGKKLGPRSIFYKVLQEEKSIKEAILILCEKFPSYNNEKSIAIVKLWYQEWLENNDKLKTKKQEKREDDNER